MAGQYFVFGRLLHKFGPSRRHRFSPYQSGLPLLQPKEWGVTGSGRGGTSSVRQPAIVTFAARASCKCDH